MARSVNRLSAAAIKAAGPGMHLDGLGLYLHVGPSGGKSWVYRYSLDRRSHDMGLGPLHTIGLAEARKLAAEQRRLKLDRKDPLGARREQRGAAQLASARSVTFKEAATRYIATHRAGWRNAEHGRQWRSTLDQYAFPVLGELPVQSIDVGLVLKVLEPLWSSRPETGSRVRGRIEAVLDYAATHSWRTADNPARWRGHLENVLPKRRRVAPVEHHPALPWREVSRFMVELRRQTSTAACALEFTILTAARTGEVIGARWSEFDMQMSTWVVPADRMKAAKSHRVPLSDAAIDVLEEMAKIRASDFVFPGMKAGKPMSDRPMWSLLKRINTGTTVHGFRSTFRDWAAETGQPADIAEAALAHARGNETVVAYQRGDLLARRAGLMQAWASFCSRPTTGDAVELRAAG